MKKSKHIELVLITAALASCNQPKYKNNEWESGNKTYVRADSTAPYTRTHYHGGGIGPWFYAFRPYGQYNSFQNSYRKAGYYSNAISEKSNIGYNNNKFGIVRGGFGRSAYSASS
ncbi:MAG: hypothetical protein ACK4HE_11005 [Chitinophagaceae bacterium]